MQRALFLSIAAILAGACGGGGSSTGPSAASVTIDSIAPKVGTVGTAIQLYGRNFAAGAKVFVGRFQSPTVQLAGTSLVATAPDSLLKDSTYAVKVVNLDNGTATLAGAFKIVAPTITRVNGVTKPTGLVGMTVLIEGSAFGNYHHGKVFFAGTTGPIQAVIADTVNDWTNSFIVTTVPAGTANASQITVQTAVGTSAPVAFSLVSGSAFSPSQIAWTQTTAMPRALQGLGAAFVPSDNASAPANYVFTVGGAADSLNVATSYVYRAPVQTSGALGAWTVVTPLLAARAYHATVAATAYTAALDTTTTLAYLYTLGGVDTLGKTTNSVLVAKVGLDGTVGTWQQATPLPAAVHSASAVIFRGYVYLAGGADSLNNPTAATYRAAVNSDGTLGAWQSTGVLPGKAAFAALVNFGPYVYTVGGDSGVVSPVSAVASGTELGTASLARINLRDGTVPAWTAVSSMNKARSKHGTLAAGGSSLFTTSGVYSGAAGSSENSYATINSDGTLSSWTGATGVNTIGNVLGYDLYNQAAVSFTDAVGKGHVMVLGGAKRQAQGRASAGVVYY